jgi:hypothetical protein
MQITHNLLIIFAVFFIHYLFSYFNQKGENLATKEDVSEITKKIEEVKFEFSNQEHLLTKKREAYEKIIYGMRVFIEGTPATEQEQTRMLAAYSLAWLWATDEVIKKINLHLNLQIKMATAPMSVTMEELKKSYTECILEMREDSGYPETSLAWQNFLFVNFKK